MPKTIKTRVETHLDFMDVERLDAFCQKHDRSRSSILRMMVRTWDDRLMSMKIVEMEDRGDAQP